MATHLQNETISQLNKFLLSIGTPLEELTDSKELDLGILFLRLKESGRINESVHQQLNNALKTKKPTLEE
ncbi:hypothetical protein [Priestia megaterium]|uniref:hypothetical protein n=1 Tax=Priestia megaterium TaxID=1404 RepID=UPI002EC8808D|nr:hypothetical protein [Priestia megaterium]